MTDITVVRPDLAGIYFQWESQPPEAVPPSIGKTAFVVGSSDWGPVNTPTLEPNLGSYRKDFGASLTDLGLAAYNVFKGQGVNGRGGAQAVVFYRIAGASRAAATHTFMNTSPTNALTIAAKYPGTRGNRLAVTIRAGAVAGTQDVVILDGSAPVETYTYTPGAGALAALAATVNARSSLVTLTVLVDVVPLATITNVALTAGNDGATVTGADWTAAMGAADTQRWAVFFPANLTDAPTIASLRAWNTTRNANGQRSFLVTGGALDEVLATATADAIAANDWDTLRVGVGRVHDTVLNLDLSTAQAAGRYAGARCYRGEREDDVFVRFADLELVSGVGTLADQTTALHAGVIGFSRDTNLQAPVFIREARTTYSDDTASPVDDNGVKLRPVEEWRNVKNMAIQHGIELDAQDWATSGEVLGHIPVNMKGRAMVVGFFKQAYGVRETAEIVQPGWSVVIASDPPADDNDDAIFVQHGFSRVRSARQIINIARVG